MNVNPLKMAMGAGDLPADLKCATCQHFSYRTGHAASAPDWQCDMFQAPITRVIVECSKYKLLGELEMYEIHAIAWKLEIDERTGWPKFEKP